jgi:hypothetical protein
MRIIKTKKSRIFFIVSGVILIALVLAYIVVTPDMKRARLRQTEKNMEMIIKQVENCNNAPRCPGLNEDTVKQCIQAEKLLADGWGNTMDVICDGNRIEVISAGPDGIVQNQDDIKRVE